MCLASARHGFVVPPERGSHVARRKSTSKASRVRGGGRTRGGGDWSTGKTSVSDLSRADQDARLGYRGNPDELKALTAWIKAENDRVSFLQAPALPSSVDWRSKSGNWITPVKDQGACGSCVSFGTVATLEARVRIACRNANMVVDLSEAQLFFCGCGSCCGTGWNFQPALDFCRNTGVALESAFPYTPQNQACRQVPSHLRISGWRRVASVTDRKQALVEHGPMVAGMAVYSDFFGYKTGVYRRKSNELRGYHAISVIGYDDAEKCWICKNSWGTGWGDGGFFKIGYGECGIDTTFPFYDVDLTCPVPSDPCRRYMPYLVRVLTLARTNPGFRACLRYYVCRRGRPVRCLAAHMKVVRSVQLVLRRCARYRAAFCRAIG